jgi:hypothetical protein
MRGFEALAFSIIGARAIFGASAEYVVCVNTVDLQTARQLVGAAAGLVQWHDSNGDVPAWLLPYLDSGMAEGVAWKLAPVRLFPNCHTLSLDNDVILWRRPDALRQWLNDADSLLIAEDVKACYGQFTSLCPRLPRNSGICGFPPGYDAEKKLRSLLIDTGAKLSSETDEQGLQVAVICAEKHRVIPLQDVSISGYFRPHLLELGSCGAHFVGVNVKRVGWTWKGRPGEQYLHAYWDSRKPALHERLTSEVEIGSEDTNQNHP